MPFSLLLSTSASLLTLFESKGHGGYDSFGQCIDGAHICSQRGEVIFKPLASANFGSRFAMFLGPNFLPYFYGFLCKAPQQQDQLGGGDSASATTQHGHMSPLAEAFDSFGDPVKC